MTRNNNKIRRVWYVGIGRDNLPETGFEGRKNEMWLGAAWPELGGDEELIAGGYEAEREGLGHGGANVALGAVHGSRVKVAVPDADGLNDGGFRGLGVRRRVRRSPQPHHRHSLLPSATSNHFFHLSLSLLEPRCFVWYLDYMFYFGLGA